MTYFLEDAPQQPMAPRGPDRVLSTWLEGVGASFSQMMRDTDANFQRTTELKDESYSVATSAANRIGIDAIYDRNKDSLVSMDFMPQKPKTVDELFMALGPNAPQIVLDMAREQANANPDAWRDLDLSEEGIQRRVTEARVKDDAEEQLTLDLLPTARGAAQFVGGALGMIADVRQLPFLVAGGGEGSLLKILGREAFLNTASEAVTLPSQFETAKELNKPDPNVLEHLATAATGGAVLGGGIHGLSRALLYFRGRSKTAPIAGMSEDYSNIAVSAAEDAIVKGEDPVGAASRAIAALPTEPPEFKPPLIDVSALPPVGDQIPRPLPDQLIVKSAEDAIAEAEAALQTDFPEMRHKNPLARKVQKMGGIQASRINPATGIKEKTPLAQELEAMGVTTKSHPFLFNKKGMADLDNIPAGDHAGLNEVLKVDSATGYFDRQDILSALAKELTSGTKTAMSGEIAARMAELRRVSDPAARPETDFVSGQQSPTGWFVKPDDYDMFPDGRQMLADSFNKYLADAWPDVKFSDAERAEMLHELQTRGGDAEYLVSRTLERDLQFGEIPKAEAEQYDWIPGFDEPPADGVSRQSGADTGRPGQDGATARGGAEGGAGGQVLEATAAGEQFIAPGIEPVTQRQRLEARQETPMRGGARPMDDGLFDMGARQQMDMFSDPASAEARPILDTMTADIRDEITKGDDFLIDMGDGKGERMASTVLDDLDKGDAAAARFDLCGRGPA